MNRRRRRFGSKDDPLTKEQADYNLKYLLAAAFLDGAVGPGQLATERIRRPDVRNLLSRITIAPAADLTERYPQATPVRIAVTLRDGRCLTRAQDDFEGAPSRPFTWDRAVEKFDRLDRTLCRCTSLRADIVDAVADLESTGRFRAHRLLTKVWPSVNRTEDHERHRRASVSSYPVMAAPMAGGPASRRWCSLPAAAGALGFLAAGYKNVDACVTEIETVRAKRQSLSA